MTPKVSNPVFGDHAIVILTTIIMSGFLALAGCSNSSTISNDSAKIEAKDSAGSQTTQSQRLDRQASEIKPNFKTKTIASFDEPWAMTALPKQDSDPLKLLVTQKRGELFIVDTSSGSKIQVKGVPEVAYGGQGGLGDIVLSPDFATSNEVYISYIEAGTGRDSNKFGAKVIKAKLVGLASNSPSLQHISPIWEQSPKVKGQGHYSHRLLFSPDGRYLFISSGERQKKDPAQDMTVNLGKIIRLYSDGTIPKDNPFAESSDNNLTKQIWTLGHRNVLGMIFDDSGNLWAHEMGPRGGDEFNLIIKGQNYGWPIVSNGRNYSGTDIPDHDTRPEFAPPKITWTPVISPGGMSLYSAGANHDFPEWQGNALLSGLSSKALIVVDLDSSNNSSGSSERYRYDMGKRMRSVLVVDGQVFMLEDKRGAKLLQLMPE